MYSMVTMLIIYAGYLKVAKRIDLKSSHDNNKKACNYVWWRTLTRPKKERDGKINYGISKKPNKPGSSLLA